MTELARVVSEAAVPLGVPFPRNREDRWDALLAASGRNEDELERIFKNYSNLYLAFQEATATLNFDVLSERALELANSKEGDFGEAATHYAHSLGLFA